MAKFPNGKMYIGKTIHSLETRKTQHKSDAERHKNKYNIVFYNAINKYGWDNLKWYIIDTAETEDILLEKEKYWIKYYNTYLYFENSMGYNLTLGGDGIGGLHQRKETKEKISRYQKIHGSPRQGKHLSEESKLKISKAHIGKLKGKENPMYGKRRIDLSIRNKQGSKQIYQINITTNRIVRIWDSMRECARETTFNRSCISDCCNHITKKSHGYKWEYVDTNNIKKVGDVY